MNALSIDFPTPDTCRTFFPIVRRLARTMARRVPSHIELDDLIAAGNVGLAAAAEKLDPTDEGSSEAYAVTRIRGAIADELRRMDVLTRAQRRRTRSLDRAEQQLTARMGRKPEAWELAEELGVDIDALDRFRRLAEANSTARDIQELSLAAESSDDIEERIDNNRRWERVRQAMGNLTARERQVVELSFGEEELTLKEIGLRFGVTEARICQIRGRALSKLRAECRDELADAA